MLLMTWKKWLYGCITVLCFASCKSIKNAGAKDNSAAAGTRSGKKGKDVRFIDGIAVTPGSTVTSKHSSGPAASAKRKEEREAHMNYPLTDFNIEKADWLQLKYAIVLDASIEKLTNLDLLKTIDHWWGTRYSLGGDSENGIDCSAFTVVVMRDVFNVALPRTAQEQYDNSERVELENLKEGDLVFFHTSGRRISHVGIYLLNNKFVHAATSGGVMVSDLNDKYWQPRYRGAGRVIK
jgi:lipoprotein Spr